MDNTCGANEDVQAASVPLTEQQKDMLQSLNSFNGDQEYVFPVPGVVD